MNTKKLCNEVKEVIVESAQHRMEGLDILLADIELSTMMFEMEMKLNEAIAKRLEEADDEELKKFYRRQMLY